MDVYNLKEEKTNDDYLTQDRARQEELRGLMVALDFDMDPSLVLENKDLVRFLGKLEIMPNI
jgi:hypothetical protein